MSDGLRHEWTETDGSFVIKPSGDEDGRVSVGSADCECVLMSVDSDVTEHGPIASVFVTPAELRRLADVAEARIKQAGGT